MTTVLVHFGGYGSDDIAAAVPSVQVIDVPMNGEVPPDVQGEVLLTPSGFVDNLPQVLDRGVQWVHEFGTGVDTAPLDLIFEGGRTLTCSRGASAIPIAEWVLAQILAAEKQLPDAWLTEAPGEWRDKRQLGELRGKTVGLVGLGGIGLRVAELALAFGCEVVAARRTEAPSPMKGVQVAPLPDVLSAADHLVVAAPSTPATHHLVDAGALASMKPGVHIVNVGRGALIDQDALREALDDGPVALASLDTVTPEPLPAGHWLYEHPKVRVSPHISWSSPHSMGRILEGFIENLKRWEAGEPLHDVVDPQERY